MKLREVDAMLKPRARTDLAVAVGRPLRTATSGGVEAFTTSASADLDALHKQLRAMLPRYALPRRMYLIDRWLLRSNGKIDPGQLLKLLETRL